MKQTRLEHVKHQMAYLKTLIPYFKVHCVLIKSHVKTIMIQRTHQELLHSKVTRSRRKLSYIMSKASLPFSASLRALNS